MESGQSRGRVIFVLSDGTGETSEKMVQAALAQFELIGEQPKLIRYKSIRSVDQAEAILEEAKVRQALVVYTVVMGEVREFLKTKTSEWGISSVDLMGSLLASFSRYLDAKPVLRPGLLHEVNEKYFRRIEAMEFTVKHDDGSFADSLDKADIVLVGVSRTSKTPLSIYLSHRGYKVANYPLVKGVQPPPMLFEIDQTKIVGLTIDAEALAKIRRERLVRMGRSPTDEYASIQHIRDEIEWASDLFRRNKRWPVYDVTNKALEETASEILRRFQNRISDPSKF